MKNTIKAHKNFDFKNEIAAIERSFIMKCRAPIHESPEYGLIAAKRTFRRAVDRNRAKRMLREWIAGAGRPADQDVLLIARTAILETTMPDGVRQMAKALKKIADGGCVPMKNDGKPGKRRKKGSR
jgi:ribonuclease P protein component